MFYFPWDVVQAESSNVCRCLTRGCCCHNQMIPIIVAMATSTQKPSMYVIQCPPALWHSYNGTAMDNNKYSLVFSFLNLSKHKTAFKIFQPIQNTTCIIHEQITKIISIHCLKELIENSLNTRYVKQAIIIHINNHSTWGSSYRYIIPGT